MRSSGQFAASTVRPPVRKTNRVARTARAFAEAAIPMTASRTRSASGRPYVASHSDCGSRTSCALARCSSAWAWVGTLLSTQSSRNSIAISRLPRARLLTAVTRSGFPEGGGAASPAGGEISEPAPAGLFVGVLEVVSVIFQNLRLPPHSGALSGETSEPGSATGSRCLKLKSGLSRSDLSPCGGFSP